MANMKYDKHFCVEKIAPNLINYIMLLKGARHDKGRFAFICKGLKRLALSACLEKTSGVVSPAFSKKLFCPLVM
jgi:hypothetical protein